MTAGRPTDYSEEMLTKTREYIDSAEDVEIGVKHIKVNLPTIEGLALFLGVNKTTIYEWEQVHEEFSHDTGRLRAKQAKELVNKGLSGDYNPTIAKVLLSRHGYREGIDTDLTSKGEKIVNTVEVDLIAQGVAEKLKENKVDESPNGGTTS